MERGFERWGVREGHTHTHTHIEIDRERGRLLEREGGKTHAHIHIEIERDEIQSQGGLVSKEYRDSEYGTCVAIDAKNII